jgi:hypothetical protein
MKLGLYAPPADPALINLTGSPYTLTKFMEHTVPASGCGKYLSSIYADPTYDAYKEYYVNTSASGSLEVQPDGKKNIIWYADKALGPAFETGSFKFSGEAVKIVYAENTGKLHHFHVDANKYLTKTCAICGGPILIYD